MLIDTHAHLYWPDYKRDFASVIQKAFDIGVKTVINIGTDIKTSEIAAKLDCSPIQSFSTIGIHPHKSSLLTSDESIHNSMKRLEDIYHSLSSKIIAIGECGLDYHFQNNIDHIPSSLSENQLIALQKKLFQAQISLAKKLSLPIIIHCRDSWEDIFMDDLKGTSGVFHHFSSSVEDAKKALNLGYYLSFSCVVTYPKNESLRQIIKDTSLDRILTETDCPFLPPQSRRGQRNEPANIIEVVKVIAQAKSLSEQEVVSQVWQNAQKLFHLC